MEIYLAILAGLGGMLGWGISDFFAKKTVDKISSFKTLFWMQIFSALPVFILFFFLRESVNLSLNILLLIFLFAAGDFLGYLLFYKGLQKGMVGLLSSVYAIQSGISVLVSVLIFGETMSHLRWLGIALSFAGIIFISFQPQSSQRFSFKNTIKGLPETLASALIFGFYFPFWDWLLQYQGQGWIAPTAFQRIFLIIILFATACVIFLNRKKIAPVKSEIKERKIWLWLIIIGFFDAVAAISTTLGYKFTSITSVVVVLSTAFALPTVILARIFLKEKLTANQIIGVIAILGGLVILAI